MKAHSKHGGIAPSFNADREREASCPSTASLHNTKSQNSHGSVIQRQNYLAIGVFSDGPRRKLKASVVLVHYRKYCIREVYISIPNKALGFALCYICLLTPPLCSISYGALAPGL